MIILMLETSGVISVLMLHLQSYVDAFNWSRGMEDSPDRLNESTFRLHFLKYVVYRKVICVVSLPSGNDD